MLLVLQGHGITKSEDDDNSLLGISRDFLSSHLHCYAYCFVDGKVSNIS